MTKFLALFCILFGVATATETGTCLYTLPLKAAYGFSEASLAMTTPKAYSDLKYCTSLASGACCTDTDINNLATTSNAYLANLTTLVAARDTYITTVKNTVLPTLLTNIQNFNSVATKFTAAFEKQMTAELGNIDLSDLEGIDESELGDIDESDLANIDESELDESELDGLDESELDGIDESELDGIDESDLDVDESDIATMELSGLVDGFSYITNITTKFLTNVDSIKSNYGTYQTSRQTCVNAIVDLQNSAKCLACDPNAAANGFVDFALLEDESDGEDEDEDDSEDDEDDSDVVDFDESDIEEMFTLGFGIAMDKSTCSRIQGSCKPYIALADGQNQLIQITSASAQFTSLTNAMQSYINGQYEAAMTQIEAIMSTPDTTTEVPSLVDGNLPYGCDTNGECEWICAGLFFDGIADQTALLVGGTTDEEEEDDGERRRLLADKRRLGDGTWAPAQGQSGVAVNFAADPGNTDKKFGSLNLGNVFVGMMVVISSILLF